MKLKDSCHEMPPYKAENNEMEYSTFWSIVVCFIFFVFWLVCLIISPVLKLVWYLKENIQQWIKHLKPKEK